MLRKFNTRTLILIFVILGALIAFSMWRDSQKGERTFKSELVNVDSAAVATISISPLAEEHKEIKLFKENGKWKAQKENMKVPADSNAANGLLKEIIHINALSLAAGDKDGWKDCGVDDSAGTRIKILNAKNDVLADFIVGRFAYDPASRQGACYIRPADDVAAYKVEGYLAMTVNQKFDQWRIKTVISGNENDWNRLEFQYPGDSSFMIIKQNNKWFFTDSTECDSSRTIQYLNSISHHSSSDFLNNAGTQSPVYSLTINGNNQTSPIKIEAIVADTANQFAIHSSQNPESFFSGAKGGLFESIFVSKNKFMSEPVVEENKKGKKK